MKILLHSLVFPPSLGGIEAVSMLLAKAFVAHGHEVKVVTGTPGDAGDGGLPFVVERMVGAGRLLALVRWCDVCLHSNISLPAVWPLLLLRRPWFVVHHTWLRRTDGRLGWQDRLKRMSLRAAHSLGVSEAIAADAGVPTAVVPNPYDDEVFLPQPGVARDADLLFVGRLVSDKGADLAVRALARLVAAGRDSRLTVVGEGPEGAGLAALASALGVGSRCELAGRQSGAALARTFARHRYLLVPSRWDEPFGIVALEGIACGCTVVAAHVGGLPDAVGPCGVTFPRGDAEALAARILELDADSARRDGLGLAREAHLARHRPSAVAAVYLEHFQRVLEARR